MYKYVIEVTHFVTAQSCAFPSSHTQMQYTILIICTHIHLVITYDSSDNKVPLSESICSSGIEESFKKDILLLT